MVEYLQIVNDWQVENEEFLKALGERIKSLRIAAGFSSYENFAWDYDLDRKQYWRAENGSNLTIRTLHKIARIHNISLSELFEGIS